MADLSLPCPFLSNVDLAARAYYGIGGKARYLALPESPVQLLALLHWNRQAGLPLALMGSGTNIVFSDEPFPGIVISLISMQRVFWISESELFCEAGAENTAVAEKLLASSRGGGEWLYKLPGQIGAAVRMNARCFGGELSRITSGLLVASLDSHLLWRSPEETFLGYKQTSLMASPEIVAGVVLRFPDECAPAEIRRLMLGHEEERSLKHHFDFPSCGSTFKNNYDAGRSSGSIFEELGFKGASEGGASVSMHHANFIFNKGGSSARDVLALAARMRAAALEQCGVELELEVECIGLFDRALLDSCGVRYREASNDPARGWAGLLAIPDGAESAEAEPILPATLLKGPLVGYYGREREFPAGFTVEIEQLRSLEEAEADPAAPFLRWSTRYDRSTGFEVKPPTTFPSGSFVDTLWNYGVSELFVGTRAGYLELEMTPEGQWVALRFDAPRVRNSGHQMLSEDPWRGHLCHLRDGSSFGMELSWELIKPFVEQGVIHLQCCGSSGRGEYGLFPWWSHNDAPPDFHQPERFAGVRLR